MVKNSDEKKKTKFNNRFQEDFLTERYLDHLIDSMIFMGYRGECKNRFTQELKIHQIKREIRLLRGMAILRQTFCINKKKPPSPSPFYIGEVENKYPSGVYAYSFQKTYMSKARNLEITR